MAAVTFNQLEQAVYWEWRRWGSDWSLFTACSRCGEVRHCRGKLRAFVLCMECFDIKGGVS